MATWPDEEPEVGDRTAHLRPLPRDLTYEITVELIEARGGFVRSDLRVTALENVLDTACALERELGRPVTLSDLLSRVSHMKERARRLTVPDT